MAERLKLSEFPAIQDRQIFLDANIWIYLFCEIGNYNKNTVSEYSRVFKKILKNRVAIFTDFTIMSEFINSYLRIAFTNYKNSSGQKSLKYKQDYKKTKDYKNSLYKECTSGRRKVAIKVVDIFGNDTMKVIEVRV